MRFLSSSTSHGNGGQIQAYLCPIQELVREAVFTREEVPVLIEAVKAARARQVMIHADYDASKEIEAILVPTVFIVLYSRIAAVRSQSSIRRCNSSR